MAETVRRIPSEAVAARDIRVYLLSPRPDPGPSGEAREPDTAINAHDFIPERFASPEDLGQWFPDIKEDEKSKKWRIWSSRRSRALLVQILLIFIIFISNTTLTIFAVARYDSQAGVGLLYQGDCTTVGNLNLWIHLLINLLSTGMLSASNYCMQLQAAPTRQNVQDAHRADKWMDIGVPSLRNLWLINRWRRLTWFVLALSSLPIHLLFNSAVFQSLTSFDYTVAVVKDSFVNGSTWDLATAEENRSGDPGWDESRVNPPDNYTRIIQDMQAGAINGSYIFKNLSDCFDIYDDYFAPQANVLVFVKNDSIQDPPTDSLLLYVGIIPRSDDWGKNMWALENGTSRFILKSPAKPVTKWFIGKPHYEVDHCLVQQPPITNKVCRFEYSPWIMYIVCTFNLVKALIMSSTWILRKWQASERRASDKQILYTLGDAIASFMAVPDKETIGLCLATKDNFVRRRRWRQKLTKKPMEEAKKDVKRTWTNTKMRWMSAASLQRWVVLLIL